MAAGDEGDSLAMTHTHHRLHFIGGSREHDQGRQLAQMRQRVAFVRQQLKRIVEDRGWLLRQIRDLTEFEERDRPTPWSIDEAPPEFIEAMLDQIVGLEIAFRNSTDQARRELLEVQALGLIALADDSSGEVTLPTDARGKGITPIAWFDSATPLRSGWAWGQAQLQGGVAIAEAKVGQGRLVLFGPEITFRAQPHGTFKFLFNGIYLPPAP